VQYFAVGRKFPNFVFAHSVALLVMPVFMLLLYYAYSRLLGIEESLVLNLINSFLTIALGSFIGYRLTVSAHNFATTAYDIAAMVIVIGMLAVYIVFTYNPPICDLFYDPSRMKYGI